MFTDTPPKERKPDMKKVREVGVRQAAAIGEVVIERLAISPAVAEEFFMRHGLGHMALEVSNEVLDKPVAPQELIADLRREAA